MNSAQLGDVAMVVVRMLFRVFSDRDLWEEEVVEAEGEAGMSRRRISWREEGGRVNRIGIVVVILKGLVWFGLFS